MVIVLIPKTVSRIPWRDLGCGWVHWYLEEATQDGEDDDCEHGDNDAGSETGQLWIRDSIVRTEGLSYQLQALKADTTGFMVVTRMDWFGGPGRG
jgi:hypothetical protein